jgi:hypothetical protein
MSDPAIAKGATIRIVKQGGGEAEERAGTSLESTVLPTYGMPSGPGGGKRRKLRTFPRGVLRKTNKIMPSKNPSKAPPTRKHSMLIVSDKKLRDARKSAKSKAANTDIKTIRKKLIEKKIITADRKDVPSAILRTLYADAVGAGLLYS